MDSPLTQQIRPTQLEPKIVELYLHLFNALANTKDGDDLPPEGFWRELFLLRADRKRLLDILEPMTAADLLHIQTQTRAFFRRAIIEAASGVHPQNENALQTLTAFLGAVFSKRFTNPSTDVIEVLAGLDEIDTVVSQLVGGLEALIRRNDALNLRLSAVKTASVMVSGSYQTSLVTYFIHRDLFPALTKHIHDDPHNAFDAFTLLGLLANYNKFESPNPYQNRLEDLVNVEMIKALVYSFADACALIRQAYLDVQDDTPVGWSFNSTLTFVGLRYLSTDAKKPPLPENEMKTLFQALPPAITSTVLTAYSFVHANKIFASNLVSLPAQKQQETPFALFLSATSYICDHAFRTSRAAHYAVMHLLILRMLLEDPVTMKVICSKDSGFVVRLCQQRSTQTPIITTSRIPCLAILDICTTTLSHNLRKKLDVHLYSLVVSIILRIISYLESNKLRLQHHWPYTWGSLITVLRFTTQYSTDLSSLRNIQHDLCLPLASVLAFSLSRGDAFLPDPSSYDDLFYKLLEAQPILSKFKAAYFSTASASDSKAINALISVADHYHSMIKAQGRRVHQSPSAIAKVIKEGYQTLDLTADEGFGRWEKWRETTWKVELKKMTRTCVEDARVMALS